MTKRILVIDDEEAILEVIQGCLEELAEWQVLTAKSGIAGLQLALSEQPDAILLDVSMQGMDGFEVLKRLQDNELTQKIPVALLTARIETEEQTQLTHSGAAGVILKPFDPIELIDRITNTFGW